MEYGHNQEETREFPYGPGKEFEKREDAMRAIKAYTRKITTQIALEGLYKLDEGNEIIDTGEALKAIVKFKYPISVLI